MNNSLLVLKNESYCSENDLTKSKKELDANQTPEEKKAELKPEAEPQPITVELNGKPGQIKIETQKVTPAELEKIRRAEAQATLSPEPEPTEIIHSGQSKENNTTYLDQLGYLDQWGSDRCIDPILLNLNAREWGEIDDGASHAIQLEQMEPLAEYMGTPIERQARQFVTKEFEKLRNRYSGAFTLEGINPITGEDSGYPRLRPLTPERYFDAKGNIKEIKYLSRKGSKPQDFYARVPLHIAEQISDRYGIPYDRADGDYAGFWDWVKENHLPIMLVEGEGDALAVLSRGYVAVGIPGHNMAFQAGTQELREELKWLLENQPDVAIAFDRDTKPKTIAAVEKSRRKIGFALKRLGIDAKVATWDPAQGKGAGDLSPENLQTAINNIVPFGMEEGEQVRRSILNPFGSRPSRTITGSTALAQYYLDHPDQDALVIAPTGAGKTNALIPLADTFKVTPIAPSRSLAASLQGRLGQPATVINSLYKLPASQIGEHFLIDEVDQLLAALSTGQHLKQRPANTTAFRAIANRTRIIAPSATANQDDLELLETITGRSFELINFTPDHGFTKGAIEVHHGDPDVPYSSTAAKEAIISAIQQDLGLGDCIEDITELDEENTNRVLCPVDTISNALELAERAKTWGLTNEQILVCTARTKQSDKRVEAFLSAEDPGSWIAKYPEIRLIIYNSVIPSGFSIVDPGDEHLFTSVRGMFTGKTVSPALVNQMVYRYRANVPRSIWVPSKAHYATATGSFHRGATGRGKARARDAKRLNRLDRERAITATTGRGFSFIEDEFNAYSDRLELRLEKEYRHFAIAVTGYLERDGFTVEVHHHKEPGELESFKEQVQRIKAEPVTQARAISKEEYETQKHKPEISQLTQDQLDAYELREFYGLTPEDELTLEMVIDEGFGRGRKAWEQLLRDTIEGKALEDDLARADALGIECYSRDMTNHQATQEIQAKCRIPEILGYAIKNGYSSEDEFLRNWWDTAIVPHFQVSQQQPRLMGFKLPHIKPGDYSLIPWVIGMLLSKRGLKAKCTRASNENGRYRVYRVTEESLQAQRSRLLSFIKNRGVQTKATPLVNALLQRVANPEIEELNCQYLAALALEDIAIATDLAVPVSDRSSHCT